MRPEELKQKIKNLKNKWIAVPERYTKEYWRYRADMCLVIKYEVKLNKFGDFEKKDIVEAAEEIFSS